MCQHLTTGYVPTSCYRICASTSLQDMCQHLATRYVSTSCYRICANILPQDMCQHLATGYVSTLCYRICVNTLLQDMCQHLTTRHVPTSCYMVCVNILLHGMCQHLTTGYVPAPHYRVCSNTSLQDMCQHHATGYVPTPCTLKGIHSCGMWCHITLFIGFQCFPLSRNSYIIPLHSHVHLFASILLGHLNSWRCKNTTLSPDLKNKIPSNIEVPTRCTYYRVYFIWRLLYMFRVSLSPIFIDNDTRNTYSNRQIK
jgi:hypothetical protein